MIRVLAVALLFCSTVSAQTFEITPFLGWTEGGAVVLDSEDTGLDGAPILGVMLTSDRGAGRKADLVLAGLQTDASRTEPFEGLIEADVSIAYAHIGGRYHWRDGDRIDPYAALTAGATRLALRGRSGASLSFAIGAGADVHINERTAIRFDGRFYTTLGGGSLEVDCSGQIECTGFASGTSLTQFAASAGLVFRF